MATINHLLIAVGLVTIVGLCGASFTFGVYVVCKLVDWSPWRIILTINNGPER